MNQNKILMCGLPASGKTSYLAALWYLLSNEEIHTALSLVQLPQSRQYLNMLSGQWSCLKQVDRTKLEEIQEISLKLKDESGEVNLQVPDMSGETWENVWSSRTCTSHIVEWATGASGIMLFLHANNIHPPVDILDYKAMLESQDDTVVEEECVSWSPTAAPTQVVLVDILQSITRPPLGDNNGRIAVMVSAWDEVEEPGLTPQDYLRGHLPLIYQFLSNGNNFSEAKIYGISALGGNLESAEDVKRLVAENEPSRRIKVVVDGATLNDLTLPIKWLMSK